MAEKPMVHPKVARFTFEHLFLPPQLPQSDHNEFGADELLKQVSQLAYEFSNSASTSNARRVWTRLARSTVKWIDLYDAGTPCSYKIIESLKNMQTDDVLMFYVKCQNATIVLRNRSTGAIFECFEILPKTDAVMSTKDALLRTFPARAVFLPKELVGDNSFLEELGAVIHKLSIEPLKQAMETTRKGDNIVSEDRQSASPRLVTEWLFGAVLSSRGKVTSSRTICKRTHDDVVWKNSDKPWRRSGVWLSIRVALQLALLNSDLDDTSSFYYKNFILFLLAKISTDIMTTDSSPDTLHVLRVKLARRHAKLGCHTLDFVQKLVQETLRTIDGTMQTYWHDVVERDNLNIPAVPLKEAHDRLTLKKSRSHLHMVWDRSQSSFTYSTTTFIPPVSTRISLSAEDLPRLEVFDKSGDLLFALANFEVWVEEHLQNWLNLNTSRSSACRELCDIMRTYHRTAITIYDGNPMRMSYMLLTIFELWVALDTIASKRHPLLLDYPPEIPPGIFAPLLLNKSSELDRLSRVELHISSRRSRCHVGYPSLFSNPSRTWFGVNFYDQSIDMHALRTTIERDARNVRDAKSDEWTTKKLEYEDLMRRISRMKCGTWIPRGVNKYTGERYVGKPRHDKKCQKCKLEKLANEIEIEKHEWPLPEDEVMTKAVIFELQAPEAVIYWRDSTWFVVHGLGRLDYAGRDCKEVLLSYTPLSKYSRDKRRRITLASSVKPMIKAHYFKSGLNIDEIFVRNGLDPKLKDGERSLVWTAEQTSTPSLKRYCQSKVPIFTSAHLSQQVNETGHSQNSVLANHSKCPPDMGPHEHVHFGSLRSGERLQFMNILALVMSTETDINSPTTAVLVSHAMSQVGNRGSLLCSSLRESQLELASKSFCDSLLSAIETSFTKIEANWKEATAATVLLGIALKVFSLNLHGGLRSRSLVLITRIRQAGLGWLRQLAGLHGQQKSTSTDGGNLKDISRQIVNACMLVRSTYDVDSSHRAAEFLASSGVADYVEASIHLHDHREQGSIKDDSKQRNDLLSDSYRARRCEKILLSLIQSNNDGAITDGIKRFWQTASFTGEWRIVHDEDTSWIQNYTTDQVVHYNLVTGSLLVSGRSLSRLPPDYTASPLYRSVFGELDLDVFPADVDDMEYMSRVFFQGHQVYFGKRADELIIRSRSGSQTFEAIPRDIFVGDLPMSILKNSLPWMSLDNGQVVFRRNENPWSSQDDDWVLTPDINSSTTISMRSSLGRLIDPCSTVGRVICHIFRPFEASEHIIIFMSKDQTTSIQIKLPRYHLNFFVKFDGDVMCKELSAVVDRSQAISTLHGLRTLLVLRSANLVSKRSETSVRTVLIPNGDVRVSAATPHVKVEVKLEDTDNLLFSQYRLDTRLGRLVSDDLEGHLFKTYLHALTSFPERDGFTSRTGTEEALLNLSDPITRTSVPLSARAQQLLKLLASLSPRRKFYPPHLKTMHIATFQEVLPVLSQRDTFFGTVHNIVLHNLKASFLFEGALVTPPSYSGDFFLLDRSHHRSRKLFACESVAGTECAPEDCQYKPRDRNSSRGQEEAFSMASLVAARPTQFDVDANTSSLVQEWQDVSGFEEEFTLTSLSALLNKPLKEHWAPLLTLCRSGSASEYSLTFIFSLIIFGNHALGPQLRALLAFAFSEDLRALPSPNNNSYNLREGHAVSRKDVIAILSECEKEYNSNFAESSEEENERYDRETTFQRQRILEAVNSSWPASEVTLPRKRTLQHYNYVQLKDLLDGRFAVWYKNHMFLSLCSGYDEQLASADFPWFPSKYPDIVLELQSLQRESTFGATQPSLLSIMTSVDITDSDFDQSKPSLLDRDLRYIITDRDPHKFLDANEIRSAWEVLEDFVDDLNDDQALTNRQYGHFISQSLQAHKEKASSQEKKIKPPTSLFLTQQATIVQNRIAYLLRRCAELLSPSVEAEQGLVLARLWPKVSDLTLLQLLSSEHRAKLPNCWKKAILAFAHEITALQRVERMQKYLAANDKFSLSKELENPAHAEWSTEEWPDWLLLEIQNQILIRPVQIRIAREIIEPVSGVVLADMGIGKSSTILPMVVTALASGTKLVRVIVLKPLANEMLRILSRSLSGLVGRAVYFLPISRQTTLTSQTSRQLMEIYEFCRNNRGVLVSLPEHLNSFRLLCNDKLSSEPTLATELLCIQKWLDRAARDVMDESDQLLEPGYELVYTTGESLLLSNSPERWTVTLEVLELVQQYALRALEKTPSGLEIESRGPEAFDHIRILNDAGGKALMACVVEGVLQGKLPSVPLGHCNHEILEALKSFLQDVNVDPTNWDLVSEHFKESGQLDILFIIRGLISHQILAHALRKRWLVNYGLDRARPGGCLAAVPYRAKAIPSQSSEFALPEVMVALTALSYYYTGLQYQDLRDCILILLRLPDPDEEFSKWTMKSNLPSKYLTANSINLDDALCLDTLYQHLRLNQAVIDFFLKFRVFPKEGREFSWKLSTSAWDLCADDGGKITTGFSGTCDSKIPSTVQQKDLPDLRHSTAATLTTILRFDNRGYICAVSARGQRLTTDELLDLIVHQETDRSIIVDIGANFLEDNKEIAFKWLGRCRKKMAAIYFNENDEKMVLNRDGTTEKFNSSIFKDEIGSCLIYLDEFHTRGTDFQLPDAYTAAVLLGPGITKDSLVQGCMRMRKLAFSQSLVFIAPPEVDQSIRSLMKDPLEQIDSSHVLRWAINQSCQTLKHQRPLWAARGMLHTRRRLAAAHHISSSGHVQDSKTYLQTIRERESRPVSEMYPISDHDQKELPFVPTHEEQSDSIMTDLLVEWDRTDISDFNNNGISEEQEREILHEVEQEREIQRPAEVQAATPKVCAALLNLIRDGVLTDGPHGLLPAFEVLKNTRLAPYYSRTSWPMQILITEDFARTIVARNNAPQDDFLRPVQWILHAKRILQPIIISPHEAQMLLPEIRKTNRACLFLYQARVSKGMAAFDRLDVYKIPEYQNDIIISPEQMTILNLFAGQLYISTFEDYQLLCSLLGLFDGVRSLPIRRQVASDNWVSPACRKANGWTECIFKTSPVQILKSFISMRRLGIEWSHTHMGRILAGRILRREDFD